jgi:hypothetical protein
MRSAFVVYLNVFTVQQGAESYKPDRHHSNIYFPERTDYSFPIISESSTPSLSSMFSVVTQVLILNQSSEVKKNITEPYRKRYIY